MTPEEIRKEVYNLFKLEADHKIKVLDKYHSPWQKVHYYPRLKELREQCQHKWRFSDFGPLGDPWYLCTVCKLHKMIKDDN